MTSSSTLKKSSSLGLIICSLLVSSGGSGCDSSNSSTNGTCQTGAKRCTCHADSSCDSGLTCISDVCVASNSIGTGGSSQVTSTSGGQTTNQGGATATDTSGGTSNVTVGGANTVSTGGATVIAAGGADATGGTTSISTGGTTSISTGGTTSISTGGTTSLSAGGTTSISAGGTTSISAGGTTSVSNSPVIDAFATCDDRIETNGGRSGKWYYFADSDFNATHSFGDPGTQWADHGCAAWMILGCTGTACTYAGLGFQLANGNPYDLSAYSGVSVTFEGKDDVYFVVKTSDGGYFGTWLLGATGNQTRNADFFDLAMMANSAVTALNTRLITEMQFTIGKSLTLNGGFGLAVHSVSLR